MIRAANPHVYVVGGRPRRADSPAAFRAFRQGRRLRGSISPAAVDSIASAIQTQEGWYPGSVAYRNNNPGNLRYVGQPGASAGAGGFADFDSYADGLSALKSQITLDATRGTDASGNPTTTISQLITSWAPPSENDTASYIASVTSQTGFDPDAPLGTLGAGSGVDLSTFTIPSLADELSGSFDVAGASIPAPLAIAAGVVGVVLVSRLF